MRETAGSAAAPAVRCKNFRREGFITVSLSASIEDKHARYGHYGTFGSGRTAYSGLMLAARITLAHFSVSSAMSLPKSTGEAASAEPPNSKSFAFIEGSARAELISLLIRSTISTGIFLGAPRPSQRLGPHPRP